MMNLKFFKEFLVRKRTPKPKSELAGWKNDFEKFRAGRLPEVQLHMQEQIIRGHVLSERASTYATPDGATRLLVSELGKNDMANAVRKSRLTQDEVRREIAEELISEFLRLHRGIPMNFKQLVELEVERLKREGKKHLPEKH